MEGNMKVRVEYQPRTRQGGPMKCPPLCFIGICLGQNIVDDGYYNIRSLEGTSIYKVQVQDMHEIDS